MSNKIIQLLKNFSIVDCAVRSRDFLYLIASHTDETDEEYEGGGPDEKSSTLEDLPKEAIRIIAYHPNKPAEQRWGYQTLKHLEFMKASASAQPVSQLVCASMSGQIFVIGGGKIDFEKPIPEHRNGPLRGTVRQVATIDGIVYVAQGNRGLCRRLGENKWESLCAGLQVSDTWQQRDNQGFSCVDGFSTSDIYAGGGNGDLWKFDGAQWHQQSFPSNVIIESICCGGDGSVYVGCQSGTVFKGRDGTWKKISSGELTLPYRDMVWFQGKVWCSSDYGIWTIDGETVSKAPVSEEIYVKAGALSVGDGLLLVAGTNGAAVFDGQTWNNFLNLY